MDVLPELKPPYAVAVIELEEGPRITANLTDPSLSIGDRVVIGWRRRDGAPPFPAFSRSK